MKAGKTLHHLCLQLLPALLTQYQCIAIGDGQLDGVGNGGVIQRMAAEAHELRAGNAVWGLRH